MKRILHIVGSMDRAGAETMLMNLYRTLDRSKFQFDFVYFTDKKCDYDDEILNLGGSIHRIPNNLYKNPVARMRALKKLLQGNPQWETIHCHTLFSNAFHLYAGYKAGVKNRIAHAHSTSDTSKGKFVATAYQFCSKKVIAKYATMYVACGEAASKFLFPDQKRVLLLPNSIDTKYFSDTYEKNRDYLRNEFKLSQATLIILQLGRLQKVKNHLFSIQIAKELKKQGKKFRLFFAGQGELLNDLIAEVNKNDLREEIIFLGVRSDVPQILAGSDVMLMPSLYEGFPVVLVESQASGVPALISDSISLEVDLGVGLVCFENLQNSPVQWVERLLKLTDVKKANTHNRLKTLNKKGFDIFVNVERLQRLYSNFH